MKHSTLARLACPLSPFLLAVVPLAVSTLASALPAQGKLERGFYTDEKLGFRFKIPQKWSQVPTQVDEKWIVAQFQSNREYEGHVKLDGDFAIHRPLMRVIQFDEKVIKKMVRVEKDDDTTIKTLTLPYRNYKDYVKRNLNKGGFHFSQEKKSKMGKVPITIYEVKVEKLAYGGRKRFIAYVFHGENGVDYAVEFEFLMHRFKKLKPIGMRSLNSFKLLERSPEAASMGNQDSGPDTFGRWIRSDWKKKTVKERHELRRQIEDTRIKKAIAGLPEGWVVVESKNFTVLSHASKKFTKRLVDAAEACWGWVEKRFGKLNDEYVSKGIIRICKNRQEYSAYRTGSADAFSIDDKEIATYEDKDYGNIGEWRGLFYAIYRHYIYDKDSLLHDHTPRWLTSGLIDYFASARVKGKKIEFRIDEYEPEAFRDLRRKGTELMMPKELMSITRERMLKGNKAGKEVDEQLVTFMRFLEGPGRRHKLLKGQGFLLKYLQESVIAAEDYKAKHPTESRKEAETEEEEEEMARKKNKKFEKRRKAICKAVNSKLCKWTDKEWKSLDRAYEAFLKKLKYL